VLLGKEMQRVTVHVAEDKIDTITRNLYAQQLFPVQPNFEMVALQVDSPFFHESGIEIISIPVSHPGGCHAFRLNGLPGNRNMAYVTDTTADPAASYVAEITGVHTLVHECYFPDGWEDRADLTGHSCLTPVVEVAKLAGVGALYLVHIDPLNEHDPPFDLDSVRTIFDRITVPSDRQVINL